MMSEANIKRLVSKLSQMRGAALKLGQFMSIQGEHSHYIGLREAADQNYTDTHVLPAEVDKIFRRVQDSAHYMPDWQMEVSLLRISLIIASDMILSESHEQFFGARLGNKFHQFRPPPIRCRIDRTSSYCDSSTFSLPHWPSRTSRSENSVPQHRQFNRQRSGVHQDTLDSRKTSPKGSVFGQNH
jgi:hypothetical protein